MQEQPRSIPSRGGLQGREQNRRRSTNQGEESRCSLTHAWLGPPQQLTNYKFARCYAYPVWLSHRPGTNPARFSQPWVSSGESHNLRGKAEEEQFVEGRVDLV